MYLKELTINGFKSFAKKGELEFSVPITAIVGPNGSGKSNVAESFRFVLGEQSVKSMRGKRGEDLIWGGGEQLARGSRASVRIILNNQTRVFPLDFDEVVLERVVNRDGQNEYLINNSSVRLKDVQELLAMVNIGATGHHIISQGEADRVLSAGARARQEMIEDALGLKVYQYKKQEAERKLSKTEENIAQVESLRREAAPHLKYLEKQIQRIEKSLKLQADLVEVYAEYLKREDTYLAWQQDRLTADLVDPKTELVKVVQELAIAKNTLQQNESKQLSEPLLQAEQTLRQATENRQKIEREFSRCEGQVVMLKRRLEALERKPVAKIEKAVPHGEMLALIKSIEQDVGRAIKHEEVNLLRRALQDIAHRLRLFVEKASTEVKDNQQKELDLSELKTLQGELDNLDKFLKEASVAEEKAKLSYQNLETERVQGLTAGREAERAVFELISRQREQEAKIERIERELSMVERDRAEFKRELQEAVTLLGRGAAQYFDYVVKDHSGQEVSLDKIINEDRTIQHNRRHQLEKMKIRLEELGIGETEGVIKEYENAKERDAFLAREIEDLQASLQKLKELIADLEGKIEEQFLAGIQKISNEFNRFFVLMFGGGSAELVKVKTKVEEEEKSDEEEDVKKKDNGVEIAIKLPNKKVRGLEMLSGGERALTSIALIFAMSQVNPPPFIILDETDAALDEANSRRYGDMIEELAKKSQLIVITHNRETMSRAGILYGVTMGGDGASKLLSLRLDEAVVVAK